ncbi:MAG: hypothetical protein AB7U18_24550, partial [Dehalococcoidia bacterium]
IDQLMTFAWKLLIPLILVQVFLNGLVLMYDLPKIVLTISGLIILAAAGMTVRTLVRRTARSPRDQRLEAMRIRAARGLS